MLRVIGRTSSINVRKVLWTASEAGLVLEHVADAGDLRGADFLALNPNGLIPVLVTDEGVLWESNTICRYLAALAARADLLPTTPFGRAEVEKWMDWQAAELNTAWRPAFMALVRRNPDFADNRAGVASSIDQWNRLMLLLEARLAQTGAYVAGADFSLADIGPGLSLHRWLMAPIERPAAPALLEYRRRLLSRSAATAWLDPQTP